MVDLYKKYATLPGENEIVTMYQRGVAAGIRGNSEQFLYPVEEYLQYAPAYANSLVGLARQELSKAVSARKLKVSDEAMAAVPVQMLAMVGMLFNELCVGIDTEKEGMPRAGLFTANLNPQYLEGLGFKVDEAAVEKTYKTFTGTRVERMINEQRMSLLRVDFPEVQTSYMESVRSGTPIAAKITMPKDLFDFDNGRFIFIPISAYREFEEGYRQIVRDSWHWVERDTVVGVRRVAAAAGEEKVLQAYNGSYKNEISPEAKEKREALLSVKDRWGLVGRYDPITGRFPLYNLNTPSTEVGWFSFRPEMLNSVKPITSRGELPTYMHKVQPEYLRGIFVTKVGALKVEELDELLVGLGLSGFANKEDKLNALLGWSERTGAEDLYLFMKSRPNLFGDIDTALEKRERVQPREVKRLEQPIDLEGKTVEERRTILLDAMDNGVVRIEYRKKDGSTGKVIATNNSKILAKRLGSGYIKKYESPRVRLRAYISYLGALNSDAPPMSKEQVTADLVDFRIDGHVQPHNVEGLPWRKGLLAVEVVKGTMTAYATAAIEALKSRAMNPGVLGCRNVYATSDRDFYHSVSLERVISAHAQEGA